MDIDTFLELFDAVEGIPVKETIEFFDNVPDEDEYRDIDIVADDIIDTIKIISLRDAPVPIAVINSIYDYLLRKFVFVFRQQLDIDYLNVSVYEIEYALDPDYPTIYRFVATCDES